ncbi:putative disease resistance protein [Cinnamomum micranthum f. kanehirae]|uniref:Putative disease resistance protein n=1 Tax=Cinnamomum micranthum f. kanehirae TaxID=337451 RepID=A0A3S3QF52_9MAGN|nr:putative disease resistance protein [Cinnamomum micranthum f. kanehirae]
MSRAHPSPNHRKGGPACQRPMLLHLTSPQKKTASGYRNQNEEEGIWSRLCPGSGGPKEKRVESSFRTCNTSIQQARPLIFYPFQGKNLRSSSPSQERQMSSVVPNIVGKLGDLLIQEAQLLLKVREGVEWIKNELKWMQRFLKDADSKQNTEELVKKWVSDIRDVSYEIEDVIETFIYRQKRRHGLVGRAKRGISEPKTRHKVGKQIEQIKQKISDISRRRETYGISDINEGRQEASSWIRDLEGRRRDSVMFEEAQLVGQHEEFRSVRDQLMTEGQRRRVISIFGIGGSGKTALAKKILNDVKVHFDCHALVYVSQQYKIKDVLVRIIKGVAGDSAPKGIEKMDEVDLGLMLRDKYLRRKRYLVVLDDIWTREAWDSLILKLPDDGNKSRVLVTTRIRDVALHADPSGHHHEMRLLNDDESWELFMKKIFLGKDPLTACPSELKEKGWKILKKCGGLPLAILVLGGLLATKDKSERAWSKVLESIPESSKQCMDILALSYWDLPHYLKPCFLYVGLFPEDYEISSGKLIRLWIAEGFIQQKGNKVMEDVAEYYLEELVSRSMIQVASKKSNGSIHKCRIHDLLRELSISEARENNFFAVHNDNDTSSSSTSVRRLAFYCNIDGDETKNHSMETLRSILYFFFNSEVDVFKLANTGSKLLRVMNTESEGSEVSLPKEVGEFVHLKFLEFSINYKFRSIPSSIGNLSSLQTLQVHQHSGMVNLPNTIWNLKELRYLHADFRSEGHPHLSNLRNLQTLRLRAGSWIEEGLGKLTNLRKLGIFGDVSSYHETLPYCIEKLRNLRSLKIMRSWNRNPIPPFLPFTNHLDLYKMYLHGSIKKLPELPPNLVELYLLGSELEQDAISTLEKLQHLKILRLSFDSYLSKKLICSPGGFLRLELLDLNWLPLEEWIVEEGAMVSLKSVQLFSMTALKTVTVPKRVRGLLKEG